VLSAACVEPPLPQYKKETMSTPFQGLQLTLIESCPKKPTKVIHQFFDNFHLPDVQHYINELLLNALTANDSSFDTGSKRSSALFFCEQLWLLAQAVHHLQKEK
jgi:hypothetical protein